MTKSKKLILSGLCVALFAVLGIFGTVAYFTDTDDDVNVMTVGNVEIDQVEQQRDENGALEPFEQGQNLEPAFYPDGQNKGPLNVDGYEIKIRNFENYIDKIVNVKNTGKNEAFVRTIIAIPTGGIALDNNAANNWLHWNGVSDTDHNPGNGWMWGVNKTEWPGNAEGWDNVVTTIDGVEYILFVATNANPIAPGAVTAPNFVGFYLDPSFNYDSEIGYYYEPTPGTIQTVVLPDGLENLKILVATQACQTDLGADAWEALDEAFGDITATNHPWMPATFHVTDADTLAEAVEGRSEVIVENDIATTGVEVAEDAYVTIDLGGNTVTTDEALVNNGTATVENGTLEGKSTGYGTQTAIGADTTFNNVNVVTSGGGVNVWGTAVWNGGDVTTNSTSTNPRHVFYVAGGEGFVGHLTINGGEFTFSPTNLTRKGSYLCAHGANATIIVNGGIFHKPSTRTAPIQEIDGGTVIIYGGSFAFDPSEFVAEGYEAVKGADGYWTVSVK